jgi:phage tail-like protein
MAMVPPAASTRIRPGAAAEFTPGTLIGFAEMGLDPFLTYNFRVKWDGRYVAAVTQVSGLAAHSAKAPPAARKIPGQSDYQPVRLERGITTDTAFEQWASMIWSDLPDFRKEMQIELYDQSGSLALRFNLHSCWPSEYTALPELDSEANTVALASLTLEHEGWERDESVGKLPRAMETQPPNPPVPPETPVQPDAPPAPEPPPSPQPDPDPQAPPGGPTPAPGE